MLSADVTQVVVLVGDLSYADQYTEHGTRELREAETSYPPRWDAWGRFMQPLAAHVRLLCTSRAVPAVGLWPGRGGRLDAREGALPDMQISALGRLGPLHAALCHTGHACCAHESLQRARLAWGHPVQPLAAWGACHACRRHCRSILGSCLLRDSSMHARSLCVRRCR